MPWIRTLEPTTDYTALKDIQLAEQAVHEQWLNDFWRIDRIADTLHDGDLDQSWGRWSEAAEAALLAVAREAGIYLRDGRGKGTTPRFIWRPEWRDSRPVPVMATARLLGTLRSALRQVIEHGEVEGFLGNRAFIRYRRIFDEDLILDIDGIRNAIKRTAAEHEKLCKQGKKDAIQRWRDTLRASFAKACSWVTGKGDVVEMLLEDSEGNRLNETQQLAMEAHARLSDKFCRLHPDASEHIKLQEVVEGVITEVPLQYRELTGKELQEAATSRVRAPGPDGWSAAELALLPAAAWDQIAQLLKGVEAQRRWPEDLAHGAQVIIPKADGGMRPLLILPQIIRAWSACRARWLGEWFDSWAPGAIHGGRRGRSCTSAMAELALELSLGKRCRFAGAALDYTSCFDRLNPLTMAALMRLWGVPPEITDTLAAYYRQTRRFVRVRQACGPAFSAADGVAQGCAVSVVIINLVMATWQLYIAKALGIQILQDSHEALFAIYLDDKTILAKSPALLRDILAHGAVFDRYIDAQLNQRKCQLFGGSLACIAEIAEHFGDMAVTTRPWCLGFLLATGCAGRGFDLMDAKDFAGKVEQRVARAIAIATKAPGLPYDIRRRVMNATFGASYAHGCEFALLSAAQRRRLCAAFRGALAPRRPNASFFMLWCVVEHGHLAHPLMLELLAHARLLRHMQHMDGLAEAWRRSPRKTTFGHFRIVLRRLGALWVAPGVIQRIDNQHELNLFDGNWDKLKHDLRTWWRDAVLRAARPRFDLRGIEGGVNRKATRHLLDRGRLSGRDLGMLRSLLLGSAWTPARLWRAGFLAEDAARCPHCAGAMCSLGHSWCCTASASRRAELGLDAFDVDLAPRCLTRCGVVPASLNPALGSWRPADLGAKVQRFLLGFLQDLDGDENFRAALRSAFGGKYNKRKDADEADEDELDEHPWDALSLSD